MKNIIRIITIVISLLFLSNQIFAKNLITKIDKNSDDTKNESNNSDKGKYNIEETTAILKSSKLGKIKLDHDDHVYKFMKISKHANDLEGAVDVLVEAKTKLGYSLDDEEVDAIIKISNQDTKLYKEILITARKIGKKKTTIREHFTICGELNKDNGKYLLTGIERAIIANYKIKNDYFSWKRLNLLIKVGKLENEDRFVDIYNAMKTVGMGSKVNSKGLEVLYKLCKINGDVSNKITQYLKSNKWKSRKQPGDREYQVIKDLMKGDYVAFNQKTEFDNDTVNRNDEKETENEIVAKSYKVAKNKVAKSDKVVKESRKKRAKNYRKKYYAKRSKKRNSGNSDDTDDTNPYLKNKYTSHPCSAFISRD